MKKRLYIHLVALFCLLFSLSSYHLFTRGEAAKTEFTPISTGIDYKMLLHENGTVWAWGNIGYGNAYSSPSKIYSLKDITALSSDKYNFALDKNGDVYYWAYPYQNWMKTISYDEFEIISTPKKIVESSDVKMVCATWNGANLLKKDGTVHFWLPDKKLSKLNAMSDIQFIYSDSIHHLAVKSNGTLWLWGNNQESFLSQFSTDRSSLASIELLEVPIQVTGVSDVAKATFSRSGILLLKRDGSVYSLGRNDSGELGIGDVTVKNAVLPVKSKLPLTSTDIFSTGQLNGCLDINGEIYVWGFFWNGRLGDNSGKVFFSPQKIGNLKNIRYVHAYNAGSKGYILLAYSHDGSVYSIDSSLVPLPIKEIHAARTTSPSFEIILSGEEKGGGLKLNWKFQNTSRTIIQGFNLYRRTADKEFGSRLNDFLIKDNSLQDPNLEKGIKYYYACEAVFPDGTTSALSNIFEFTKLNRNIILQLDNPLMLVDGFYKKIDAEHDVKPLLLGGRTYLPIRSLMEELDGAVSWDEANQEITILRQNKKVSLRIASFVATVDDKTVMLDSPARIIEGRTLIPLRFVIETFGLKIDWNAEDKSISISS